MKIAVQTDDTGQVIGLATVYGDAQLQLAGWQEVEADPYFNTNNYSEWKVSKGRLVKSGSGLTPLEENQKAIVTLTQQAIQAQAALKQLTKLQAQNEAKK